MNNNAATSREFTTITEASATTPREARDTRETVLGHPSNGRMGFCYTASWDTLCVTALKVMSQKRKNERSTDQRHRGRLANFVVRFSCLNLLNRARACAAALFLLRSKTLGHVFLRSRNTRSNGFPALPLILHDGFASCVFQLSFFVI